MSNIKFTHYNVRGRGETVRLILAYAGRDYEDKRVTVGKMVNMMEYQLDLTCRGNGQSEASAALRTVASSGG